VVFITSPPIVLLWVVVLLVIFGLVSRVPSSRRGIRGAVGAALLLVGLGEIAFAALGLLLVGFGEVSVGIARGFAAGGLAAALCGGAILVGLLREPQRSSP
jgi:hypothetical protein